MLRKAAGIFLTFLILSQGLINLGFYGYYHANKKMIADKLCINKSKPQMHCNGHCFLSKQLKQAEQKEQQQSKTFKEKEEQVLSAYNSLNSTHYPWFAETGRLVPCLQKAIAAPVSEILQPPRLVA